MKLSIKQLLLLIALLSITLTLASSLYAGYRADQEALKKITLETNSAYAQKLAKVTEEYLLRTERTLAYSANSLKDSLDTQSSDSLNREAERLTVQSESLSSVVITDHRGIIRGTSKGVEGLIGEPLRRLETTESLHTGMPVISEPFVSQTGRLIVFISTPIQDSDGSISGLVGGSIYLSEENVLYNILGQHFYEDGSYVYVVSKFGMLMYHLNSERVGEYTAGNPVIEQLKKGNSGSMQLINSKGQDMLAGYAVIPLTGWGVVSQRPTESALAPSGQMIREMVVKSLPFLAASTLLILYLASKIADPLVRLANYADGQLEKSGLTKEESGAWYREAIQLDRALTDSFNKYQAKVEHFIAESSTDPLTSLLNRRALTEHARLLAEQQVLFSLIILDIDRFKQVNDTYGHTAGDEVLKFLADHMTAHTGKSGSCYRYGGEEFVILLSEKSCSEASLFTEVLREIIESEDSPVGRPITFSAGVAEFPVHADHIVRLIELADGCLYHAKETGRNRVVNADEYPVSV